MSKVSDISEVYGDYAIDVEYGVGNVVRLFFNSYRNARTVKRCIEVDDSIPNVATAVDFVEVVRCKDCKYWKPYPNLYGENRTDGDCAHLSEIHDAARPMTEKTHFCSAGERIDNAT